MKVAIPFRLPSIEEVLAALIALHEDCSANCCWDLNCDDPDSVERAYVDVRLQLFSDGSWDLHSGDASYDISHGGHWGAAAIYIHDTAAELEATAAELIDQAAEDIASSQIDY